MFSNKTSRPKDSASKASSYHGVPEPIPEHLQGYKIDIRDFIAGRDTDALAFTVAVISNIGMVLQTFS